MLGLSDYAAFMLWPGLSARLERQAPNVSLVIRNTSHGAGFPMLEEGSVELIAGNFPEPRSHLREELLYDEDFVCAGRSDHPALAPSVSIAIFRCAIFRCRRAAIRMATAMQFKKGGAPPRSLFSCENMAWPSKGLVGNNRPTGQSTDAPLQTMSATYR